MVNATLPELVAQAYEAACGEPDKLRAFVAEANDYFSADGSAYLIWARDAPAQMLSVQHRVGDGLLTALAESGHRPESLLGHLARETAGKVLSGHGGKGTPGWPDRGYLAMTVSRDAAHVSALLLLRGEHGDFSHADHDTFRVLGRYLQRASNINRHFVQLQDDYRVARRVLDSAPRGIIVLGPDARLCYANAAARQLLAQNDGISEQDGRLAIRSDTAQTRVMGFLQAARAGELPVGERSIAIRVVPGSEHAAYQLVLYALPWDERRATLNRQLGLAVGMVHDPQRGALPSEDLLAVFFGLTPAEAQLAQALCAGESVTDIARQLSVSVHTARTHLRNIFGKVGVHSQHALVQRISQSLHIGELNQFADSD